MRFTKSKYWQQIKKSIPLKIYEFLVYLYFKLKKIGNSGNNVFCNVCELKQARFISKSCGNCGAAVRHRTVSLFLQRKTNVFNDNLKLLHFAPEFCFVNRFKKKGNIYLCPAANGYSTIENRKWSFHRFESGGKSV